MSVKRNKKNTGFTIVELMVSVAIFVLITSVILARHSQFSNTIIIENLAYDIALSIRKAQVFGLSIREFGGGFDAGYGVHFDGDSSYIFFSDTDGNDMYSSGTDPDTVIDTLTLGGGNKISKFCVSSPLKCFSISPPINDISSIDIIFNRPNPDAIITVDGDSTLYSLAEITILSPRGAEWTISAGNTGQISVQK